MAANFALNPAQAIEGVIDFSTAEGTKLYRSATKKLQEDLFDCEPDQLYLFLQAVETRANENGWNVEADGILWIPVNLIDPNNDEAEYFIDNYGSITLQRI